MLVFLISTFKKIHQRTKKNSQDSGLFKGIKITIEFLTYCELRFRVPN